MLRNRFLFSAATSQCQQNTAGRSVTVRTLDILVPGLGITYRPFFTSIWSTVDSKVRTGQLRSTFLKLTFLKYSLETSRPGTELIMSVEASKKTAARAAVDNHVTPHTRVVGVGSGSTIVYAVERLGERVKEEGLQLVCVPTSFQARQLVTGAGLQLADLETEPSIDVTIDGCDEADAQLTLIKGGGGCQTQEKVVAEYSKQFVVIADYRKKSEVLGQAWDYVPLEVLALSYRPVMMKVEKELGGRAQLRMAKNKAGPVVTDNGGLVVDWFWDKTRPVVWSEVNKRLQCMAGVVETGLFVGMADEAYFGMEDGSVEERSRS